MLRTLGAAAAGGALPLGAAARTNEHLELIGIAQDSSAECLYAADRGMFAKAGLDVGLRLYDNPGANVAAVIGGSANVSSVTVSSFALAHQRGVPIVYVAPGAIYSDKAPTSGIFVARDSPLRTAADLNGKTVAVHDINDLGYYGAKAWIDRNGGDSSTVKWFEIAESAMPAALKSGRIDAASASEPTLDNAIHGPDARLLAASYDAIAPSFLIVGYFSTAAFAAAHPQLVRAFSRAILEAGTWANRNHDASAKIVTKYTGLPVGPTTTRVTYAEEIRPADAQPVLDLLARYGVIKEAMRATDLFAPQVI